MIFAPGQFFQREQDGGGEILVGQGIVALLWKKLFYFCRAISYLLDIRETVKIFSMIGHAAIPTRLDNCMTV